MPSPEPDRLMNALRSGVTSAPELVDQLQVSQATISRLLTPLVADGQVLKIGATRGARYGLRRSIADIGSAWPLFRVDANGTVARIATLYALAANQFFVEREPNTQFSALGGLTEGLPYFLQDQRPNGFLGRMVPQRYPELHLPDRVDYWNDDHFLCYFTRHGSDAVSDLVLGELALNELLAARRRSTSVALQDRQQRYAQLAEMAMHGGLPGSSAHGEQPKFAASIDANEGPHHVLVKFSPPVITPIGRRWSDLLVAEHQAHRIVNEHGGEFGLRACQSEVLIGGERTYLQVKRFDRHGLHGRIGVTSLFALDTEFYGRLDNWIASATRLHNDGYISAEDLRRVRLLSAFASLIANTDKHFGNVAFFDRYDGHFELAPMYDMPPMLFAPQHDQLIDRPFNIPHATADTLDVWNQACAMAQCFWSALAADGRISSEFKQLATRCAAMLSDAYS